MKMMHSGAKAFGLCILIVLWACISTAQTLKKPVFTSFDYPGSVNTEATAITPSGEIVGRYLAFDGTNLREHGFLLTNGRFQPIDFPDAIDTDVTYINPRGEIVGFYDLADGKTHGYILRDGTFTSFDFPGAAETFADGIGPNGEVVGAWFDQAFQLHGFVLDKQGKFTQFDVPGFQTLVTQITSGRMIGDYANTDFTIVHGFVVKNGIFQSIDFPAYGAFPACQTSFVSGLNPEGDIVGGCSRNFLDENGWLVKDGEFVPINYPNSLSTYANGINPQGQIVGRYSINDGHLNHGFLLTWQP